MNVCNMYMKAKLSRNENDSWKNNNNIMMLNVVASLLTLNSFFLLPYNREELIISI